MMRYFKVIFIVGFAIFLSVNSPANLLAEDKNASEDVYQNNSELDRNSEELNFKEIQTVYDPYEKYNRFIFRLNDKIYDYFLTPFSKIYDFLIPKKIQSSFDNLFFNIRMPVRFFNNILQGKFKFALDEIERFLINSTLGIGGFFDPAKGIFKIEPHLEDFGQTLGYYGVSPGPYIVWPFLGPSNRRDSLGLLVDIAFDPLYWVAGLDVVEENGIVGGVIGARSINNYSYNTRDNYQSLIEEALDPYVSLRHAYTENRNKKIKE